MKTSEMVWGQTIPLFLLTILHGVCCGGIFDATCSAEPCQCGAPMNILCTLTHPVEKTTLIHNGTHLFSTELPGKEGRKEINNTIIEWTKDKVKVTISKVTFSDNLKYILTLDAKESKGNDEEVIPIKVSGLCEPEMFKNNKTKELECVAESENNATIVWMDDQRKLYQATKTWTPEKLAKGYKLWSSLGLTEEIGDNICCSVSYRIDGEYKEKKSCMTNTSGVAIGRDDLPSSINPSLYIFFTLLAVALVAAAFGYLLKRRSRRIIVRAVSQCEGPLIDAEPKATEATTETV